MKGIWICVPRFVDPLDALHGGVTYPGNYAGEASCPSRGHVACFLSPSGIAYARAVLNARKPATLYMGHNVIGVQRDTFLWLFCTTIDSADSLFGFNGGDDGARTRDLCRDRQRRAVTY
jgi:hypothetical protein